MGCLVRKLFLLLLLVAAIAAGWWLRSQWSGGPPRDEAAADSGPEWQALTEQRAARARTALERFAAQRRPDSLRLEPGDLGSLVLLQIQRELPASADSLAAAVVDDLYHVRASVRPAEIGGTEVLGSLGGFLGEREPLRIGGSFHLIRPGLAEYRVREIRLREFPIPERMLPRLMARIRRGAPVAGLSPTGLPLEVPVYIRDVHVADGSVTLYKTIE
jgi:hypothetical protein